MADSGGEVCVTVGAGVGYRIEMQVASTKATNGLGLEANMVSQEVYTEVWVEKYA
jgi:hypothetical protein